MCLGVPQAEGRNSHDAGFRAAGPLAGERGRRAAQRRPGFRTHREDAYTPACTPLRPGGVPALHATVSDIRANVTLWEAGQGLESQVWERTGREEFRVHEGQKSQSSHVASNIWSAAAPAGDGLSRLGSYSGASKAHRWAWATCPLPACALLLSPVGDKLLGYCLSETV